MKINNQPTLVTEKVNNLFGNGQVPQTVTAQVDAESGEVTSTTAKPKRSLLESSLLKKDDFLKLLMAQMRYQDPMAPMDNQAFVAQLAQFSSLEQIQNVSTKIEEMKESIDKNNQLQSLTALSINNSLSSQLIGKQVVVPGDTFYLTKGSVEKPLEVTYSYELQEPADLVHIKVTDEQGNLVYESNEIPVSQYNSFRFTAITEDDKPWKEGRYHIEVKAEAGEESVEAQVFVDRRVAGIIYFENGANVVTKLADDTNETYTPLSQIKAIIPE